MIRKSEMIRHFFIVLFFFVGFMNQVSALPWFENENDLRNNNKLRYRAHDEIKKNQIDFSGRWSGQCDSNPAVDLTIKHTREHISISYGFMEEKYIPGEVRAESSSCLSLSESGSTTVKWNQDNTALIFINYHLFINESGSLNVFFSKVSMALEQEQLVVKGQHFQTGNTLNDIKQETISCIYDRK
ncbi:TPA: lpg2443 family Dot/Icm T4SS effector [Legionella pneumophila]|nr:lpg2443 family Dot/Icm T4SS effector [Legionella pneumophila]HAT8811505.1 lpg2443 family Dot/Icm T4SS effector [Legionella pneumophila]HAU2351014.1 lpg2443 family Dot/Icm T4SS effector [Legionella pneumophila]HAU2358311.1 lpg2443 family Dot/Icm T4SS effector [Legionella pneumophila]